MLRRRTLIAGCLAAGVPLAPSASADTRSFAALEQRHAGRLGVAVLDTASGKTSSYRGDERFPLCSTYKFLAAAHVLARIDRGQERLDRRVEYGRSNLVTYSPVTEQHLAEGGMTVAALCEAAITLSDNTAGNLLLDIADGPGGLTGYLRALGDPVTRLDRHETALNEALPGDPRDTTTPLAMAADMQALLLGSVLRPGSRELLTAWLVGCKTGDNLLRAGAPKDWRAGDKSGAGERNSRADIAVFWPPGRAPILVAAYSTLSRATNAEQNALFAEIGRIASLIATD